MSPTRILVVEDDPVAALLLEDLVCSELHECVGSVATGREAIALAAATRPDLAIMDIVLPGELDGIETARILGERFGVQVLYLTGATDPALFARARATSPVAYLTKPFDEYELKQAIEVALDRHALVLRLQASEAHLAEAQAVAHIGSWRWDLVHDRVAISDELMRLLDLEPGRFAPRFDTFLALAAREDQPRMQQAVEALVRGEDPGDVDIRLTRNEATARVLRVRGKAHFDAQGQALELVGTARDVSEEWLARREAERYRDQLEARVAERTAELSDANTRLQNEIVVRRQAQETLRHSEARYRGLIENLPEAVLVLQHDRIVFANPAAARLLGVATVTALQGMAVTDLVLPEYREVCDHCKQAALMGETNATPTYLKMQRKDGASIEVESLTFAFDYEGQPAVLSVVRDLTARRAAERTAERFRVALDSSPDAVFVIDPTAMCFLDVNETACASLGYERDELLRLQPQHIKPHFNQAMLRQHFAAVLAGQTDADIVQTVHRRKDGSTFPVEIRLRAFTSEGQPLMVAVARDISERQLAEAALRESNERFEQFAANVSEAFWIRDLAKDRFLYVSPAYESVYGKSVASLYRHPRSFLSVVHPDDLGRVVAAYEQHNAKGRGVDLEYRVVGNLGEIRWLWVRTFPIHDATGRVYRMAGIAQDITQRRASEEQFRNIIQTSMDGFWMLDARGRLLDSNEAGCHMLGYEREELLALSIPDIEAQETPAETGAHIQRIIDHGHDRFETRQRRKDGRVIDVESSVYYQRGADGGHFYAFLRDITARKQSEASLRDSEERFRLLFEHAPIGIAMAGPDRRLLRVNQAMCDMLGYSAAELTSMTFVDITHPDDIAANLAAFDRANAGEIHGYHLVKRYRHRDGSIVWVSLTSSPIRDQAGAPLYSVGMIENITERMNAEQLRLAHETSQREALVREVHHRIKNNLQGVIGLLRQQIAEHPGTRDPLEAAIAQIMTISVVHGLQSRLPHNELRLRELLPEIARSAASLAMVGDLAPPQDHLRGDAWLDSGSAVTIALVLNELVHNALKHGGQAEDVHMAISGDASEARIAISNPGTRLPEGFDLTAGQGLGTGLGLVRTLLPRRGANLTLSCDGIRVSAAFVLTPPVIADLSDPAQT